MREIERKASDKLKDFISRIGKNISEAEGNMSGSVGRGANKLASGVESMAERLKSKPKQEGPSYSQADLDKAMEIWKTQGMGKIGNKPKDNAPTIKLDGINRAPSDKMMNKPIPDYITNSNDPYTMMKYGEMSKKILKQNYVEKRPYTRGERQLGRDVIGIGATGGLIGDAINYAMDSNEADRKKASEPQHFMSKEVTSQQDAHNSWTKKKYGNQ